MKGEHQKQDFKETFDLNNPKAKVDLVKNIVAIANSGGGNIIFGRSESQVIGIDEETVQNLDSARLDDLVFKYVKPARVTLGHHVEKLPNGKFVLTLSIQPENYPVVMSRQGSWSNMSKTDKEVFYEGDIWVRHSSKTEKITYDELKSIINEARTDERNKLLERIQQVAEIPEDSEVIIVREGQPIDTPKGYLEQQVQLRNLNKNQLIEPFYLNWLFLNRNRLKLAEEEIGLLIGSSLRRTATLYYWVSLVDDNSNLIIQELENTLSASDRDKSDAARSILDLAAVYATDEELKKIIDQLKMSRYAHFRTEAEKWRGREEQIEKTIQAIEKSKYNGKKVIDYSNLELREIANDLARKLENSENTTQESRNLAAVTRAMWLKTSVKLANWK